MSSDLIAQLHFSFMKNAQHEKYVLLLFFNEAAPRGEEIAEVVYRVPFLIKRARLSLGWRMCSIQWNGYLGHDE